MIKAIIFDMDGVISDTQHFHAEAESCVLKKYGIIMPPDQITINYAGVSDKQMFYDIFTRYRVSVKNISEIVGEKWKTIETISRKKITAMPFAIKLVDNLSQNKFPLAVASASLLSFINLVIASLHIKDRFSAIVSAEEVRFGKPAPDIFLLAAKRLGVSPSDCVVIEDGKSGIIGAQKAGMKCIALISNKKTKLQANICVTSLKQITINMIKNIDRL